MWKRRGKIRPRIGCADKSALVELVRMRRKNRARPPARAQIKLKAATRVRIGMNIHFLSVILKSICKSTCVQF